LTARGIRGHVGVPRSVVREILVIGDVRFLRDGVATAVSRAYPEVRVRASGLAEAPRLAAGPIDLLVVELDERSAPGLGDLRATAPTTPVLGLVLTVGPAVVVAAAALGVRAFVSPSQPLDDVVGAVAAAARGETVCPPAVAALLFDQLGPGRALRSDAELTARERQVAALVARGLSNKEIAAQLYVEPATVKNHVHRILQKLQCQRRGEAAALLRSI
jgi:two-component system, NarL family, nitrate/nitrite response regulator NarL